MKFKTYDFENKEECITEIKNVDLESVNLFINTWVPEHIVRLMKISDYTYSLFKWDEILKRSMIVGSPWSCFSAFTCDRLDGLLCLSINNKKLKIEYIACAPWNYYKCRKMRNIGSGLIYYVITCSKNFNLGGEFYLDALPDAEEFYKGIGMFETGNVNKQGIKEYKMPIKAAQSFIKKVKKNII